MQSNKEKCNFNMMSIGCVRRSEHLITKWYFHHKNFTVANKTS